MNIHALRLFQQVANHGSFTRAATAARISQPAVSKAVAELESSIGLRLFERGSRPLKVTDAGRRLLNHAFTIFEAERMAIVELNALRTEPRHGVMISASEVIAQHALAPVVARFCAERPHVPMRVTVSNLHEAANNLGLGNSHLALVDGMLPGFSHLATRPWLSFDYGLYVGAGSPLAALAQQFEMAMLNGQPMLCGQGGSTIANLGAQFCIAHGVKPSAEIVTTSTVVMLAFCASGIGFALAPCALAQPQVDAGELVRLPLDKPLRERALIASLASSEPNENVQRLLEMLLEAAEI